MSIKSLCTYIIAHNEYVVISPDQTYEMFVRRHFFSNIVVVSVVEGAGVPGEHHRPIQSH